MAKQSAIEWTDATFNGWIGCTKVSPACDNCYASVSTPARSFGVNWGAGEPRRRTSDTNWRLPLKWNELAGKGQFVQCDACGLREFRKWDKAVPPGGLACCSNPDCNALPESESTPVRPRVFCSSLADVFDNEVDPQWLTDLLDLIRATPNLDWLLLTKRIGNAKNMVGASIPCLWPANVWLGATICNQAEADRDIPKLLAIPARVRFLSIEPLLGPVDLTQIPIPNSGSGTEFDPVTTMNVLKRDSVLAPHVDWVIVGGESGPNARPMHPEWVTSIREQCAQAAVPFLFKQWGEWAPGEVVERQSGVVPTAAMCNGEWQFGKEDLASEGGHIDDEPDLYRIGKRAAGRLLDGVQHDGYPEASQHERT